MRSPAEPESFRLVIPSQTRYLNLVTGLAKRAALVAGMDDATSAKISIAVDEAVTNVIVHAYKGDGDHLVDIELRFMPQSPGGAHPAHRSGAAGGRGGPARSPGDT